MTPRSVRREFSGPISGLTVPSEAISKVPVGGRKEKNSQKHRKKGKGVEGREARKGTRETLLGREAVFHFGCLVWMGACRRLSNIGKHAAASLLIFSECM